jgi:hypothetical protein
MTTTAHVTEYAAAVRAALADVPEPDRTELLEDLEDHLREIAVESTESLTARLGTPESYAAELRAAYTGTTVPKAQPKPGLFGLAKADYRRRFPDGIGWPEFLGFLREFLVLWWILRAVFAYLILGWALGGGAPRPTNALDLVLPLVLVVISVAVGILTRNHRPRGGRLLLLIGANVLVLVAGFSTYGFDSWKDFISHPGSSVRSTDYAQPAVAGASQAPTSLSGVVNIYPYSKDGKPLTGILLYDQNGNPIQTDWRQGPYSLTPQPSSAPPVSNSYPQPLCGDGPPEARIPQCALETTVSPTDSASPEPSRSPEPTGSTSPTVSPSGG